MGLTFIGTGTAFARDAQIRYIEGGRAKLVEEPDLTTLKDVKFFVKPPDFSNGGGRGNGKGSGGGTWLVAPNAASAAAADVRAISSYISCERVSPSPLGELPKKLARVPKTGAAMLPVPLASLPPFMTASARRLRGPSVGWRNGQPKRRFQLRRVQARGELSSGAEQAPERLKPQSRERPR